MNDPFQNYICMGDPSPHPECTYRFKYKHMPHAFTIPPEAPELPVHERPDWDSYFIEITQAVAKRADCRRRQVGCVIVGSDRRIISTGYNGAPAGDAGCLDGACPRGLLSYDEVQEFTDYDSGPGRCISLHAEANALLYAGKLVRGGTAYVTAKPCPTCSKLLIAAGIDRVVYLQESVTDFDTATRIQEMRFRPQGYIKR